MNRNQTITLFVGLGVLTLLCCIPPWKYTFALRDLRIEKPGPYAIVFSPPEVPRTEADSGGTDASELPKAEPINGWAALGLPATADPTPPDSYLGYRRDVWSVGIDARRFLPTLIPALMVPAALLFVFRDRASSRLPVNSIGGIS